METKVYHIENLGCANCAAKMEDKMNRLEGVEASLTFATRQLRVKAEDPDGLLPQLQSIVSSIEADARIVAEEAHHHHAHHHDHDCGCEHDHHAHDGCCGQHHHEHHHDHCDCGHDHHEHHHEHCGCGHDHHEHHGHHHHGHTEQGLWPILIGAGLFVAGLVLSWLPLIWAPLAAFVAAYLVLGWQILATAARNLVKGRVLDENFLMSVATLGAFAIWEFPEAVGVMLFYRVGEYFEHRAVERSRSQIMEAVDLRPETVMLADGKQIPAAEAKPGDLLTVRPGDRIPLDGIVISGESNIDTAPITGESLPVFVAEGAAVTSGCVNLSGLLTVRVEKPLAESMVTRILQAVESAAAGKPKIDRFITRFARVYTPVVVAIAVLTAVIPSLITGQWNYWVYTALSFLVMSCPCALVLSVPLAFFSGIGVGSKKGILFKGGATMEALAGIKQVALDKTGTVTEGSFGVQQVVGDVLEICAACEKNSTHPIAQSIVAAAKTDRVAEAMEEIPGCGVRAVLDGETILCGNDKLMERFEVPVPPVDAVGTKVYVARTGKYLGYILIADKIKEDAGAAVAQLESMGISAAMLTGDEETGAKAVAKQVGIQKVYARLLPQDKLERLQKLRRRGGSILFVGDGINDAPVLAGADVGAAMGSGADAAIEAADVVFLTGKVHAIPDAISIARRTKTVAWQNVIFALAIKAIVMVLGLLGLASMWLAVFADSGVAMLCVLNSIRMLYKK